MKTFRKAVSLTFSSVLVFGNVPFNAVSVNGLDTLRPQKSKKAITNHAEDVEKVTGLKGVEGKFVSFGTKQDFLHSDVAGKVAVVTRGLISVGEQIKNAIAAGAVALVMLIAYSLCQTKEAEKEKARNNRSENEQAVGSLQLAVPPQQEQELAIVETDIAQTKPQHREVPLRLRQQHPGFAKNKRAAAMCRRIRSSGRSHDSPCGQEPPQASV